MKPGLILGRLQAREMHVAVKRILRKHGYPPDKQERATALVIEQAEQLGAGSRAEGVEALPEQAVKLVRSHGRRLRLWETPELCRWRQEAL
jgi:Type I restriction enzyme HindI endonuclease subunit-like, C-terminal